MVTDFILASKRMAKEEEQELWEKFWVSNDDSALRMQLVEAYLPLVVGVANKLPVSIRQKVKTDELLGSGVVGLHAAISAYSRDKEVPFVTFAYKRVRGAMLDELRGQDHLTRTQRNRYKEICAAINRLGISLGRPPTDQELSEAMNMSIGEIDKYIGMGSETVSIYEEFQDGMTYQELISDSEAPSPSDYAHNSLAIEKLREYFRHLDEREQKILFLRHYQGMSVKEIATVLEVSEGRISQIYQKVVLKLRTLMSSN